MWDLKKNKIIFPFGNVYAFNLSANSLVNSQCVEKSGHAFSTGPSPTCPNTKLSSPNDY